MNMNPEQTVGQVRTFLAFFGGIAAGLGWTWFAPVSMAFLDALGPVLAAVGPVMGAGAAIWSAINKTQPNIVRMAAGLVDDKHKKIVQQVQLAPTAAGAALERATPDLPQVSTSPIIPTGPSGIGSGMSNTRR